ncbi:BtpA/SgcQ family protein [Halostella sp. JP-L12]|uniref:BtpA/SgcQ family protein n=1 Tax=Halostella TaxID=1843185 RepID=UPI000EF8407F|nr:MULTISPECIES: BtpA/SgcQ family protein [Halostella]NHN49634.1 BtpA/SgcQ family protein [Halostella sp. JP-L12]
MELESVFGAASPVVGMVHLPPLPGSPGFDGDRDRIEERALSDARTLAEGGADAVLVENFGDAPFYPDDVPKHVVASMTAAVERVADAVSLPVGVNVLRNDAETAVSVAAATGADFVRVNVHSGAAVTDQGVIEGAAHETVRLRDRLDADVSILADVGVKHAAPLGDRPFAERVADAVERGMADGVVVSGAGTGEPTPEERLDAAREEVASLDREVPLFVGSGVTAETVAATLSAADGVIVGTALKEGGETTNPVDPDRVRRVVEARDEG